MTPRAGTVAPHLLLRQARDGNDRALARLVTLLERRDAAADQVESLVPTDIGAAWVVGITGPPGAGKSTLTGALAALGLRDVGRVAVVAVDPSSPHSGGAILGDRLRMDEALTRGGVFIRSMATRGQGGGVTAAVPAVVRLLAHVGYDLVIVETVGVGQVELDVAAAADTTLVVVTPGWGDAIQANKAGILEVADVLVVNKADRPGADDARRDLELMLHLGVHDPDPDGWRVPVALCTATTGAGVDALWGAITGHRDWADRRGRRARKRAAGLRHEARTRAVAHLTARVDALVGDVDNPALAALAGGAGSLPDAVADILRDVSREPFAPRDVP